MSFFSFLSQTDAYSDRQIARLDLRKSFIVDAFAEDIAGARVLDIAAHDGRWSYALAAAGARRVIGIEGRADLIARYDRFPDTPFKDRVKLRSGDLYDGLDRLVARGQRFDVVALYGIFYHVMDHMRLLDRVRALGPRLVIIDSEFVQAPNLMIQILREATHKDVNAIARHAGQEVTLVGVPSMRAMEAMAEVQGYDCRWSDWLVLPKDQHAIAFDYFRKGPKRRMTCALRPR